MHPRFQSDLGFSPENPLLLAVALAIIFATQRAQPAKENAKEFKDMCKLYDLLSATVLDPKLEKRSAEDTLTSPSTRMTNIMENIRKLNLTVLPSTVEKALRGQPPEGGWEKAKDTHEAVAYFGKDAKLAEIATRIKTLTNDDKDPWQGRLKLPLPQGTANKLRRAVAHLAAKAEELETEQKFLARELTDMQKKARYHAFKALYGSTGLGEQTEQKMNPDETIPLPTEASKFPWDNSKTQTQTCGAGARTPNTKWEVLATDMVCICVADGMALTEACTTSAKPAIQQFSGSGYQTKALAAYTALIADCSAAISANEIDKGPTSISTAITNLYSNAGRDAIYVMGTPQQGGLVSKRRHYLGTYAIDTGNASNCDSGDASPFGTASKGVCIDYGDMLYKKDGIPWVVEAKKAEAAAQGIPALFRTVEQIVSAIESKLENLLLMGDLSNLAITTGDTKQGSKQTAIEEQNDKCKNPPNKTAEGCASVNCNYDDKEKECKPKPGTETAATGTGETPNVEGKRCSDFKDQTSCEAALGPVPAGKAKFCGWITYVDGKGKLDTPECRDFSFPVDQKLVLMAVGFKRLVTF
uniref:Variant surface glycoprotein 1125.102 n=1 Tax=Trypanosoma brucei TaxID=5691 RepID=A0A1J0R547_9TRYP|nr:variant surface glycoprotein 1125.102 [Trypanosoma brucei]